MLLNLSKKTWTEGLLLQDFENQAASNDKVGAGRLGGCVVLVLAPPALPVWLGFASCLPPLLRLLPHCPGSGILQHQTNQPHDRSTPPLHTLYLCATQPNCSPHTHPGGG